MKKLLLLVLTLLISISFVSCKGAKVKNEQGQLQNDKIQEQKANNLVKNFGSKLQNVSLLAPKDILEKSMQDNYGNLVSSALITKWEKDPLNAPGRLTSSPWPDRIEIQSTKKVSENEYQVKGEIIEITSNELEHGGIAAKRPITLVVRKINNKWLIDEATLGKYENSLVYQNTQYGFNFTLPSTWKGYSIVTDKWEGASLKPQDNGKIIETGPIIYIRNPKWTSRNPMQDIPIMVFTINQWNSMQNGDFHIGAAPINPSELGRNTKYVFALPARYNYAFLPGYQEVEDILKGNPLQPVK